MRRSTPKKGRAATAASREIVMWRTLGYRVELFFLRLPTPGMAVARVAQRVSGGGHDVPKAAILQRTYV